MSIQELSVQSKHPKVFAFIDSQNLNMGVGCDINRNKKKIYVGWKLDFRKFRIYLKDKYKVETAFIFIGNLSGNEGLYEYLQRAGYVLILKPTTSYQEEGKTKVKGNVDTDLVLYAGAREIDHYDKAVIVSGDGDFLSLYDYLTERNKLGAILIPNKQNYSSLLNKYSKYFDFVSVNKKKLNKEDHKK